MRKGNQLQLNLLELQDSRKSRDDILSAARKLRQLHREGLLGGEIMPEDANPGLEKGSRDNYHYFTLPMALNYQRNSYKLWESALATYRDLNTRFVFFPEEVVRASEQEIRSALTKYKVAIQPNKHTSIWMTLCSTFYERFHSDVRELLTSNGNDIVSVLEEVQNNSKKGFPYISGHKIANYWLYVLDQYTDAQLKNRCSLSIAPDTHVIQASIVLGLISPDLNIDQNAIRPQVAEAWRNILEGTEMCPIDVHTPLWLWSRRHFTPSLSD